MLPRFVLYMNDVIEPSQQLYGIDTIITIFPVLQMRTMRLRHFKLTNGRAWD